MKKTVGTSIIIIVVIAVIGIIVNAIINESKKPGEYDEFATCISDSGATFFGAFWCPHCIDQKRGFGKSEKLLSYVECSQPNRQGQLQVCIDEKIESYPTWEFADGERLTGLIPMDVLAEKTSCELPVKE
jgi:hypothetical protein